MLPLRRLIGTGIGIDLPIGFRILLLIEMDDIVVVAEDCAVGDNAVCGCSL